MKIDVIKFLDQPPVILQVCFYVYPAFWLLYFMSELSGLIQGEVHS